MNTTDHFTPVRRKTTDIKLYKGVLYCDYCSYSIMVTHVDLFLSECIKKFEDNVTDLQTSHEEEVIKDLQISGTGQH